MISHVTYNSSREELARLLMVFHEEAARMTREQWQIDGFFEPEEFKKFLHKQPLVDLACMEAASDEDVAMLEAFRGQYKEALLMVIADGSMSPMKYLKPSIMPGSLLLRPVQPLQLCQVVRDFIQAYLEKSGQEKDGDAFSGGRLRDARRDGGHPCVQHFPPAGLGEGKKSGGNGSGADEGASGGSLEPHQFPAHLSGTLRLHRPPGQMRGMSARGVV